MDSMSFYNKLRYCDHYALFCVFKNVPTRRKQTVKVKDPTIWNLNKPDGWKKYFAKTDKNNDLKSSISSSGLDSNGLSNKIEEIVKTRPEAYSWPLKS